MTRRSSPWQRGSTAHQCRRDWRSTAASRDSSRQLHRTSRQRFPGQSHQGRRCRLPQDRRRRHRGRQGPLGRMDRRVHLRREHTNEKTDQTSRFVGMRLTLESARLSGVAWTDPASARPLRPAQRCTGKLRVRSSLRVVVVCFVAELSLCFRQSESEIGGMGMRHSSSRRAPRRPPVLTVHAWRHFSLSFRRTSAYVQERSMLLPVCGAMRLRCSCSSAGVARESTLSSRVSGANTRKGGRRGGEGRGSDNNDGRGMGRMR